MDKRSHYVNQSSVIASYSFKDISEIFWSHSSIYLILLLPSSIITSSFIFHMNHISKDMSLCLLIPSLREKTIYIWPKLTDFSCSLGYIPLNPETKDIFFLFFPIMISFLKWTLDSCFSNSYWLSLK